MKQAQSLTQTRGLGYVTIASMMLCWSMPAFTQEKGCVFNDSLLSFAGSPLDQATCLLRPVQMYAKLGEQREGLPAPLDTLIGKKVRIDKSALKQYLADHHIDEADIGGSISAPLSRANNNDSQAPFARYLIIHDTSTPNLLDKPFPAQMNEATWNHNNLSRWDQGSKAKAHVFINRVGKSLTAVNFSTPWRATKFELQHLKLKGKGLFLHVELVQTRRSDPEGRPNNDAIAPEPGFTDAQLERLALVYLAASVRRGDWLIPAFHAVLDAGLSDAHDDPQHFDLEQWANHLGRLLQAIQAIEETRN